MSRETTVESTCVEFSNVTLLVKHEKMRLLCIPYTGITAVLFDQQTGQVVIDVGPNRTFRLFRVDDTTLALQADGWAREVVAEISLRMNHPNQGDCTV